MIPAHLFSLRRTVDLPQGLGTPLQGLRIETGGRSARVVITNTRLLLRRGLGRMRRRRTRLSRAGSWRCRRRWIGEWREPERAAVSVGVLRREGCRSDGGGQHCRPKTHHVKPRSEAKRRRAMDERREEPPRFMNVRNRQTKVRTGRVRRSDRVLRWRPWSRVYHELVLWVQAAFLGDKSIDVLFCFPDGPLVLFTPLHEIKIVI